MDVDRRQLIAGIGGLAVAACSSAQTPASSPTGVNWPAFKARFMAPDGRILDTGNGGVSHSEGQSYGLAMAVQAGDRAGFETIHRWTQATLARPDVALPCWRYDPRAPDPITDRNNATDGDLLIAYALAKAAERWHEPRYAARSRAIVDAVSTRLIRAVGGRMLLLPGLDGFSTAMKTTINPSYYVWPALDLFARTGQAALWRRVVDDGEALLVAARFGSRALPTDWVDIADSGAVSPGADRPARFGFDAIRVPLYAVATGRSRLIAPIRTWWQTMPLERIPAWVDVISGQTADYGLSEGGRAVAERTIADRPARPEKSRILASDYYSASLQCLAAML